MRRRPLLVVLVALGSLIAMPAAAKEGVHAKLISPARLDAPAGQRVSVVWRLVDAQGRSFGASGIYLRVSRCARPPVDVPAVARGAGRYSARVKVPRGGVRRLSVGLKGWRIIGDRRERADVFFRFDEPAARPGCRRGR
jgi:hypothetical protein